MIVGLVVGFVIGAVAGIVGGSLLSARNRDLALAREMRRLSDEQRRATEEGRDAAISAAVRQVREMHEAILEGDRARAAAELDGRKALIDQELHATRDGLTTQMRRVD